jgi:opacity protein-like surface antigen
MMRIFTIVAAIAFLVVLAMPAQAQEKKVRFGLQGGVTVSSLSGNDVDSDTRTGFFGGLYFNYLFSPNWTIGIEGNWLSGIGAKNVTNSDPTGIPVDLKMSYFELPVTFNFVFPLGESEKAWLRLQTGITPMLNLTCKVSLADTSSEVDCDDEESVLWAVPFGAALGFKLSDAAVAWLGARYQLGLSNAFEDLDAKHQMWEFLAGVGLPIG